MEERWCLIRFQFWWLRSNYGEEAVTRFVADVRRIRKVAEPYPDK